VATPALDLARALLRAGYTPLPVKRGEKKPAPAAGTWARWQKARPTEADLLRWFGNGDGHEIGVVLPASVCVLDVDARSPAHLEVDARAQAALLSPVADALVTLPCETSAHFGRHYFARLPEGCKLATTTRPGEGLQIIMPGQFVRVSGQVMERLPAAADLPMLPAVIAALFTTTRAVRPAAKKPVQIAPTPIAPRRREAEELAEFRELLPDLVGVGPWRATCPLHDDARPSLSLWRDREGRLRWRCHAIDCIGRRGGTLGDLRRRLWRAGGPAHWEARFAEAEGLLRAGLKGDALALALAVLRIAHDRSGTRDPIPLEPSGAVACSYRRIAQAGGPGRVLPDGTFENGAAVKRALLALEKAGAQVSWGRALGHPDGPRRTAAALGPLLKRLGAERDAQVHPTHRDALVHGAVTPFPPEQEGGRLAGRRRRSVEPEGVPVGLQRASQRDNEGPRGPEGGGIC
jgi:hypothetical protein